jgi:hypothetical protein
MFQKIFLASITSIFLILTSSCSLSLGPYGGGGTNPDTTAVLQTRVAELVASTDAAQTAIANAVESTLAAKTTQTPAPNVMPTSAPTLVVTLSPQVPTVSVSVQTNCRSGPGAAYEPLGMLNVGETAEVVGRNMYNDGTPANDSWIIKLPSNPTVTCWLWGMYATVAGNTAGLPVVNPPPTPTAPAPTLPGSFNVTYYSTADCPSGTYAIKFDILNTGSIPWESNRVVVTDLVTGETREITRDSFPYIKNSGCMIVSNYANLPPGAFGTTASLALSADPTGHGITATIQVCSQDGLAGTCMEKTITFTGQ